MRREAFANVFFPFVVAFLIYAFLSIKKNPQARRLGALSLYFVASHILLDLGGPMALFFPFDPIFYQFDFLIRLENFVPKLYVDILTYEKLKQGVGGLMKTEGLVVLVLSLLVASIHHATRKN
ncbi:MAG: hypothetical protein ABH950_04035 [Candidatus Altiarchaeota archaeon]